MNNSSGGHPTPSETLKLVRSFMKIRDPQDRARLLRLAEQLASKDQDPATEEPGES